LFSTLIELYSADFSNQMYVHISSIWFGIKYISKYIYAFWARFSQTVYIYIEVSKTRGDIHLFSGVCRKERIFCKDTPNKTSYQLASRLGVVK